MTNPSTHGTHYLAVYGTLADWEYGHLTAHLPGGVTTVGPTREPVTTAGGLRILPDLALEELTPEGAALLVLPGAEAWHDGSLAPFARAARTFLEAGVPVAAICGATFGLALEGLLDDRDHTSGAAPYLASTGYKGAERYREADAVTDGGLITAGPTEPVAFAREALTHLGVFTPEVADAFHRLFARSDASAYETFAAATA